MRCFIDFEFKVFIPHFILPEILCIRSQTDQKQTRGASQKMQTFFNQARVMFIHIAMW